MEGNHPQKQTPCEHHKGWQKLKIGFKSVFNYIRSMRIIPVVSDCKFFADFTLIAAAFEFQSDPVVCLSHCSVFNNRLVMPMAISIMTIMSVHSPTFIFLNTGDFSSCLHHIAGPLSQLDSVEISCKIKMQHQRD